MPSRGRASFFRVFFTAVITVAVVVASPFPVLAGGSGVEIAYFEKILSTFGTGYLVVEAGLAAPEVLCLSNQGFLYLPLFSNEIGNKARFFINACKCFIIVFFQISYVCIYLCFFSTKSRKKFGI